MSPSAPPPAPPAAVGTGARMPVTAEDSGQNPAAVQPPATVPSPSGDRGDAGEAAFNVALMDKLVIRFKHNSNELSDESYQALERFAGALIQQPELEISIKGYTDSTGALSYNMSMSELRANLVKGYLVGKGVDPERISVRGMGPENPVAPNTTEEGRSQNRRVEIEFIRKPAQ
jgi:outer membrane protein OmpA-like peptidoglycan-associated protein